MRQSESFKVKNIYLKNIRSEGNKHFNQGSE